MRVAVVPGPGQSGLLRELGEDGSPAGRPVQVDDLAAAVSSYEQNSEPRWVWPSASLVYHRLLLAGVRVTRCHDVALAGALISGRDAALGGGDSQDRVAEARALLTAAEAGYRSDQQLEQPALFDPVEAGAADQVDPRLVLDAIIDVHADQLRSIAADEHPDKFSLLITAESAGSLVAAEMTTAGLPWRSEVHDALLTDMLGPRPMLPGQRPARLAELADQVAAAFGNWRGQGQGAKRVNPDSPSQLLHALAADGIRVPSTRLAVLRDVDHPAIPPLLEYKELSRLYSAFAWSWLDTWVSAGRFRPEYVVGGVVSGRWASRGGGALQIPRMLRRAVVADPGWVLVVADASQLEPRVLAALAGDRAFADAAMSGDLYAELAAAFGGERAKAKVAMLSAMYGGAGGEAGQLLAVLRQRFPAAAGFVEAAARAGEEGRVVRSVLGRTCPPPSANWRALTEESADPDAERDPRAGQASRARGRFTRNFVVQASAADWALVMLVSLRAALARTMSRNGSTSDPSPGTLAPSASGRDRPELVFFQHDEVIVHCPQDQADAVAAAVAQAAAVASRLVFGPTRVAFPLSTAVVDCYADAK
ncbi:MAG: bifunctional 3'-5' exonuclease/DNA polymerase [Streptosporangiaceae bacterium]